MKSRQFSSVVSRWWYLSSFADIWVMKRSIWEIDKHSCVLWLFSEKNIWNVKYDGLSLTQFAVGIYAEA